MAGGKGPEDLIQESFAADKTVKICLKAEPIPAPLLEFFSSEKYRNAISRDQNSEKAVKEIRQILHEECTRLKLPEKWIERMNNIWSIEPVGVGDNFLIGELPSSLGKVDLLDLDENSVEIISEPKAPESQTKAPKKEEKKEIKQIKEEEEGDNDDEEKEFDWMEEIELKTLTPEEVKQQLEKMKAGILNGFRHSIDNGPLCGEPVTGVALFVVDLEFYESKQEQRGYGTFSGQIMSAMSQGCKQALLVRSMRIVEPVYGCFLEVAQEVLGQATGLIRKRRGQILSDTMKEGTNWFEIDAEIPVVESFGLCKELRNWSSGSVTIPSLVMKGWRQLEDDPFYVPRSEEDKEEWGDNVKFMTNRARDIMNEVRKRKGVFVEKQLVESANKQRTLSKKK
uniref:Elongation factor 2 n=1 Tax=Paramoeba aestuarina TaxID=180227 RepID=A0A7S4K7W4_9EUKA